jgi:hypothetical protein
MREAIQAGSVSGKWLRTALVMLPIVACAATYLLLPELRLNVDRIIGFLLRGDLDAVRTYVLSYGA